MHACVCVYIYIINIHGTHTYTVGEFFFDPLLILYVCPLKKKWSVYNFNGRFISTVRDRITTKKTEKRISKKL